MTPLQKTRACVHHTHDDVMPSGYVARAEWAAKMLKTHRQTRCPGCRLWKVWVPR